MGHSIYQIKSVLEYSGRTCTDFQGSSSTFGKTRPLFETSKDLSFEYQHNEQARTALKFSLTLMPVIWAYVESQESVVNKQIAACSLVLLLCRDLGFSRAHVF